MESSITEVQFAEISNALRNGRTVVLSNPARTSVYKIHFSNDDGFVCLFGGNVSRHWSTFENLVHSVSYWASPMCGGDRLTISYEP
jgi:enoyl-[acyl-carrier-protein] reductase (NADH)